MTWYCWSSSKCIINNYTHGWLWKAQNMQLFSLFEDNNSLTSLPLCIAGLVCFLVCYIVYWCWYQTIKLSHRFTSQHRSDEHNILLTFYWALFSLTRVWLACLNASWQTGFAEGWGGYATAVFLSAAEIEKVKLLFCQFISRVSQCQPPALGAGPHRQFPTSQKIQSRTWHAKPLILLLICLI